eukprot:4791788-Alexandrium_andersonii.AAC.1
MSASLVGSEMCIRDSGRVKLCNLLDMAHLATKVLEGGVCAPTRPLGAKPVSYTHLTLPTICSV